MKILHVLNGLKNGGIESLAIQLIKHAPYEVRSDLLNTIESEQSMETFFKELKIKNHLNEIYQWKECDGIFILIKTFFLCLKIKPDGIILYPCNRPMLWLALGARLAGVRKIAVTVQNTSPKAIAPRKKWKVLLYLFNRLGVLAVPCSEAVVNSLQPFSPKSLFCKVIHNGCDTKEIAYRSNQARSHRPTNDNFRIIMVARLDSIKDQRTLIKAFSLIKQTRWQLQLVGEGSQRKELENLANDLGLNIEKTFLGKRLDIPELLGNADLFAFSTTPSEGFGIALIEAMAAGLPIIASDVPACREVLHEGEAGELLPPGDVKAWSRKLLELIESPSKRKDLSKMSQKFCYEFDIQKSAMNWYELLKR